MDVLVVVVVIVAIRLMSLGTVWGLISDVHMVDVNL